jgi:hypothetical protein
VRKRTFIGALLLCAVSALLGGTVLRDQVASARSAAQSVLVSNPPSQPVPVQEQGTVTAAPGPASQHRRVLVEYFQSSGCNGCVVSFQPIKASMILLEGDLSNEAIVELSGGGKILFGLHLDPNEHLVIPLSQSVTVDKLEITHCFGSIQCFAEVTVAGS